MERVVIVEALSTGKNYVKDCVDRGLEPVVLEPRILSKSMAAEVGKDRRDTYPFFPQGIRIIQEKPDYGDTLAMVRELRPLLVIPGCETGVVLATRLAEDLGLPGNPYGNIEKMTNKFVMQQALKEYGIRYIRSRMVSTEEEAIGAYREMGTEDVVIKPFKGAGSENVFLCRGEEEMLTAFRGSVGKGNVIAAASDRVLLQERIIGGEYIVNTLSCNGSHRLVSIWKYDRKRTDEGNNVHVGATSVKELDGQYVLLVRYAFQVLDALGIRYGAVHGEFMIDAKGPVLIEANCRVMGANMPAEFTHLIFGHHETDVALDSYLDPEKFAEQAALPYRPKRIGIIKSFYSTEEYRLRSSPILILLPRMRSYFEGMVINAGMDDMITKTKDFESRVGVAYLVHSEDAVVLKDYDLLCQMERDYLHLLYEPAAGGGVSNGEKWDAEEFVMDVLTRCKGLRLGDSVRITKERYSLCPYGMSGMAMLLKLAGLTIEAPLAGEMDVLRATME